MKIEKELPLGQIWLRDVRASYLSLWTPNAFVGADGKQGSAEYQATGIMGPEHPDIQRVRNAMQRVAVAKWAAKAGSVLQMMQTQNRLALHSNAEKAGNAGYDEGGYYVKAGNTMRPTVLDRNKAPLVQADGKPYSGCYINMLVELWAQDNGWGKRVNARLLGLQFVRDGEAFGGGAPPATADAFDALEGSDADDFGAGIA